MRIFEPRPRTTCARLRSHACFVASLKYFTSSVTVHVQLGHSELFMYGTLSELPNPSPAPGLRAFIACSAKLRRRPDKGGLGTRLIT